MITIMKKSNLLLGLLVFLVLSGCSSSNNIKKYKEEFTVISTRHDRVTEIMNNMTLEEKVGQLFFARMPVSNVKEAIQTYHLGGLIIFDANLENESYDSLKAKLSSYQEVANIPLFIASDEEGGYVTRLSSQNIVDKRFKSPLELYNAGGMNAVINESKRKSETLLDLGINLNLAPVVDYTSDRDSFIFYRTLGQSFERTLDYISKVTSTMQSIGVGSTLKHFPGYGHNEDSHLDLVFDTRSRQAIDKDLLLFKQGIDAGANSIMVSHNIIKSIDPNSPASVSKDVIDIIRNDLNFNGVVMTDDLDMKGITKYTGQNQAALRALQAGNDLVMTSQYEKQIPYIIQAINDGNLSMERVNQSVYRILAMKYDLNLLK